MLENKNTNIPDITVNTATNMLLKLCRGAVRNGFSLKALPSVMLWGSPGVGKSALVKQFAKRLEADTGKHVSVTDIRLLLYSPVDLRGVPTADETHTFSRWLMPKIFDLPDGEDAVNIIFLDEISAAPQSVQAAAYQICLDHRIGEHELPDNTIVIAAGNRTTDRSVAYKMPAALANRMLHLNITSSFNAWKHWAYQSGIDERIIGYLSFDNSVLCEEPDNNSLAYPTPRSWEFVSTILKTTGLTVNKAHNYISAAVGTDNALAFEGWCEVYKTLPTTQEIFAGSCHEKPGSHDALYALISSMTAYAAERKATLTADEIDNAFFYITHFPEDFVMLFFDNIKHIEGVKLTVMKCPSVKAWLRRRGKDE